MQAWPDEACLLSCECRANAMQFNLWLLIGRDLGVGWLHSLTPLLFFFPPPCLFPACFARQAPVFGSKTGMVPVALPSHLSSIPSRLPARERLSLTHASYCLAASSFFWGLEALPAYDQSVDRSRFPGSLLLCVRLQPTCSFLSDRVSRRSSRPTDSM